MCYNTLCDKYATPGTYGYTPSWALNWDYRKELILRELLDYRADVICLQVSSTKQEIECRYFEEYFKEQLKHQDYDGIFFPKSRFRTMNGNERRSIDGCAILYKTTK